MTFCNDLFIAAELAAHKDERAKEEKKKKLAALQLQDAEVKVLTILQQKKSAQSLIVKELDVLLAWQQAPKVAGAKKQRSWYNGRTLWPVVRQLLCLFAEQMMMKRG